MAIFRDAVAAAAIGLQVIGIGIVSAEADTRPSALSASFKGTLLDGPLAGQIAIQSAIPSDATRHIKIPYGVAVCVGGNNRIDLETHGAAHGGQNRSCHW